MSGRTSTTVRPLRTKTMNIGGRIVSAVEWDCLACGRLIGWNAQEKGVVVTQCWQNRCKANNALVDGVPCLMNVTLTTGL